ncbi:MAG: cytochrome b N-terminal domain-containing protein, partial [Verrucomicrobiota bacterium]
MKRVFDFIDHRTGYRHLSREALFENIPGGSRWRYVWGSTLTFTLAIQIITGLALWMAYSPSSQTAWESVFYIQNEMWGGWFLRGLHHYTAQAMNILLVLHLMQVVIDGAYKAPREVNFWFGVILMLLVLALSLTGYLLPWDQKGFWATKVATNIAGITPVIGPGLQKIIIGGSDYGHHTLTRFFALHAGVLPAAIIGLLVAHIYLFRRHGITCKEPFKSVDTAFWPDQVLKDAVACLAVLAAVLFLIVRHHGADLGAPADPSEPYSAARPEWYFLFLFQFLKFFPGGTELWGAIIIPGLLVTIIFLMPWDLSWAKGARG